MALLPAPVQANFNFTVNTPNATWNAAGDSVVIWNRSTGATDVIIHGIGFDLPADWSRIDMEIQSGGGPPASRVSYQGMFVRDSATGRYVLWSWAAGATVSTDGQIQNWTNSTTRSNWIGATYESPHPRFLRMDCDDVSLIPYYSDDWDGIGYIPTNASSTTTIASFVTNKPTQAGIFVISEDSLFAQGIAALNLVGLRVQ